MLILNHNSIKQYVEIQWTIYSLWYEYAKQCSILGKEGDFIFIGNYEFWRCEKCRSGSEVSCSPQGGLSAAPARAVSAVKNMNLPEIPRNINIGDINIKVPSLSPFWDGRSWMLKLTKPGSTHKFLCICCSEVDLSRRLVKIPVRPMRLFSTSVSRVSSLAKTDFYQRPINILTADMGDTFVGGAWLDELP